MSEQPPQGWGPPEDAPSADGETTAAWEPAVGVEGGGTGLAAGADSAPRPELAVAGAFAGGLVAAMILKRLGS